MVALLRFLFQVSFYHALFSDRGATLLWTVQKLPALTELRIVKEGQTADLDAPVSDSHGLPGCNELAQLRSCSLTQLTLWLLGGPPEGETLRLSGLPELRSCLLVGDRQLPPNIRIDAASFQGTPQLQDLHVNGDAGFQLQPGSLGQLSVLTSLTLMECGLRSVPTDIASLGATLCQLDLSHNSRMQFDADAVSSILQCSSLVHISLYKSDIVAWERMLGNTWQQVEQHMAEEGFVPALFSMNSLKNLMYLPDAFRVRHGRALHCCFDRIIGCLGWRWHDKQRYPLSGQEWHAAMRA